MLEEEGLGARGRGRRVGANIGVCRCVGEVGLGVRGRGRRVGEGVLVLEEEEEE